MKRRTFLGAGAALTVLFTSACSLPTFPRRPVPGLAEAQGWIAWRDGRFRLYLPRAEMGQNIATGLCQIACEELQIEPAGIDVLLPDTRSIARVRATVGSESMKLFALPLARACATLRRAIDSGQRGVIEALPIDPAQLRSFSAQPRHVGRSAALVDGRAIITGAPLFAADVRHPQQLFGRVLRAPLSPELGAALVGLDEDAARRVAGCVAVVRSAALRVGRSDGVGIVARTPAALERIAAALAPQWREVSSAPAAGVDALIDVDRRLRSGALRHRPRSDAVAAQRPWTVDLRFDVPAAAHAAIEPRCAVAEWRDGRMTVWAGTQDAFYIRDVIARELALAHEQVLVQPMRIGGAFGARTLCTVELEAAVLAQACAAPVKVQWTRAQEFGQAFHRPPSSHRIRARVHNGRIEAWWHALVSSHILFTSAGMPPWLQGTLDLASGDAGVARGLALPYRAARQRIEHQAVRLPYFTGPWRGLGAGPNLLALESAIDECAWRSGHDPLAFRLANLDDGRLKNVLRAVAEASAWRGPAARADGGVVHGRGIACGIYKDGSFVAVVADVTVERASGSVRVAAMWCAHDCGLVVNPDQVRAQVEGNLVWSIGMVLIEELPFLDGAVAAASFLDAPIARMGDVPPLHVTLMASGAAPSGAGETALVAGGAAIANAVRAATGVRFGQFPLKPAQVLARWNV